MNQEKSFHLRMRAQRLQPNDHGHNQWETMTTERDVPASRLVIIKG
jgi:hypothetical protein